MRRKTAQIALAVLLATGLTVLAVAALPSSAPGRAQGPPEPTPIPVGSPPPAGSTTGLAPLVINEIAWGGTGASPNDEWIELLNVSSATITLTGWTLTSSSGLSIVLTGTLGPGTFYLLERGSDAAISDIPADQVYAGGNLLNSGQSLFLLEGSLPVDSANTDGGQWPAGSGSPDYRSMERVDPLQPDADANWRSNDGVHTNGLAADGLSPIVGTPGQPNSTTVPPPAAMPLLISEVLYDALTPSTSGDEFVEVCNPLTTTVELAGYKLGDEENAGAGEGMYHLPDGWSLAPAACLVAAKNAAQFMARFGLTPTFELVVSGNGYTDTSGVPNLAKYGSWGSGSLALSNTGDEALLLGPADQIVDSVAYGNGDYARLELIPGASAPGPDSLQRLWPDDRDWMAADFYRDAPTPGYFSLLPAPPAVPIAPELPGGMKAFWGALNSRSSFDGGDGPPALVLARARARGLHFLALTDGSADLSQLEWGEIQHQAALATVPDRFVAWPGQRWTVPRGGTLTILGTATRLEAGDPSLATLAGLYAWLAAEPQAVAEFDRPLPETDFDDFAFDPVAAAQIALLQIGAGLDPHRTFEMPWLRAQARGWHLGPTMAGADGSTEWGTDDPYRTGLIAPDLTGPALLAALKARRVFASDDPNLALAFRSNEVWMGDRLPAPQQLSFEVFVFDGDREGARLTLFEGNLPLRSQVLATTPATWTVAVEGRAGHYYWVKVVQPDGDVAHSAPLRIDGPAPAEMVWINEIVPGPSGKDWNQDGLADADDEWLEIFNPGAETVGLGGWQLVDAGGASYEFPLTTVISPSGFYVLFPRPHGLALNNDGDTVSLRRLDLSQAFTFEYDRNPSGDLAWCLPREGGPPSDRCLPTPGAANVVLPPAGPLKVSIFEAKHLTKGAEVKIKGKVTAPPNLLQARVMYIQDDRAGIQVYLPKNFQRSFDLGDRVEVTGKLGLSRQEWRISVQARDDVRLLGGGEPLPPLPVNSGMMVEPYEGMLVQLEAWPVEFKRGSQDFWVDDGTGWAFLHLFRRTGLRRRGLEIRQPLTVVGIVGQDTRSQPAWDGYRLQPRYHSDIIAWPVVSPASQPAGTGGWPTLLPATGER